MRRRASKQFQLVQGPPGMADLSQKYAVVFHIHHAGCIMCCSRKMSCTSNRFVSSKLAGVDGELLGKKVFCYMTLWFETLFQQVLSCCCFPATHIQIVCGV